MNGSTTDHRSVAGRAGHDPRHSSAAWSRVLIDPDRPDAAHPIMPPGHDLLADHAAKG